MTMGPSILALVGYAAWFLLLATSIVLFRTLLVLQGKFPANGFLPNGEEGSAFMQRLCRAHANCYENLPVFASLILLAAVTGNSAITDPLARWVLVARVAQSTVHLISTSEIAVSARATLLVLQIAIEVYWVVQLGLLGFS